jgi:ATP/maltotriose-dependent transcriptional regulator MalT
MLEEMGESGVRSVIAAYLAAVLCELGKDEDSERMLAIGAGIAEPDDLASQIVLHATRARLLVRRGDLAAAERQARAAVELAAGTDFPSMQAEVLVAMATVQAQTGGDDEARALLERARRIHEEKGNVVMAARLADVLVKPLNPL